MPKYRKKPVVISAWRVRDLVKGREGRFTLPEPIRKAEEEFALRFESDATISIDTLEGTMRVGSGWWIICGVNGELYPCKDDIFQKTYEPVVTPQDFGAVAEETKIGGSA